MSGQWRELRIVVLLSRHQSTNVCPDALEEGDVEREKEGWWQLKSPMMRKGRLSVLCASETRERRRERSEARDVSVTEVAEDEW